jgi:hypothetical protein
VRVVLGVLGVLFAVIGVGSVLVDPVVGVVILVSGVASMAWLCAGLLRMGAYVYDDHLLVRTGMGRARKLLWSDIEAFELEYPDGVTGFGCPVACLVSAEKVRLDGTRSSMFDRDYGELAVAELQANLASRRPTAQRPPADTIARSTREAGRSPILAIAVTLVIFAGLNATGVVLVFSDNALIADLFFLLGLLVLAAFQRRSRRLRHRDPGDRL